MKNLRSFFNTHRLLLIAIAFILYGNTLSNGYAIDDSYVTQKDNITSKGFKVIPGLFTSFYVNEKGGPRYDYRPMVKVSYAVESQLFGTSPFVSHFINILLYIVCLFLVYKLLLLLFPQENKIAFYAALLFALLPIHTEVVASLKNRDVLLCFIFTLQATIFILRWHIEKKALLLLLAALNIIFSLLSKLDFLPYLAIIPVMLFVRFDARAHKLVLWAAGLALVYIAIRFASHWAVNGQIENRNDFAFENPLYTNHAFSARIFTAFNCFGFYVVQCILPFKQSCYYGADTIGITSFDGYGMLGILLLAVLAWGLYTSFRKKQMLLFLGLFIFTASISMYINLLQPVVGIVADRFPFFASMGLCMAALHFMLPYLTVKKTTFQIKTIGAIILVTYAGMAIARNADWKNSNRLIAADVQKYPNSAYLNYLEAINVMDSLEKKKKFLTRPQWDAGLQKARQNLERTLEVSPNYPSAMSFLSYILIFLQKDYQAGLPYINRALQHKRNANLVFYKAVCLHGLRQDSSEYYLKETIRMDSSSSNAYKLLMEDYNNAGKYTESVNMYNDALKKGLQNEFIYTGLATTYFEMKDTASAEFYCQKAFELNPNSQQALRIMKQLK